MKSYQLSEEGLRYTWIESDICLQMSTKLQHPKIVKGAEILKCKITLRSCNSVVTEVEEELATIMSSTNTIGK
jgi:hypothetical protein